MLSVECTVIIINITIIIIINYYKRQIGYILGQDPVTLTESITESLTESIRRQDCMLIIIKSSISGFKKCSTKINC